MRKWTHEQVKAIETEPNLLVSAAAGSGKTAVLVERITRKLIPDENGEYVPIDRLLVVTFAKDAAREMQTRIKASLEAAYAAEESRKKKRILSEQLRKLPFAEFSTIDSFCMRFVKQNFHLLSIDPAFKIFDPTEASVFMTEAMDEYFDKLYEDGNEHFLRLVSLYAKGYDDREVMGVISEIYNFTRSLPNPEKWLRLHAEDYIRFEDNIFCQLIVANFKDISKTVLQSLNKILSDYESQVDSEYGNISLIATLNNDISVLSKAEYTWNGIYNLSGAFEKLKKTSSMKPEAVLQKEYIDYREAALEPIRQIIAYVKGPSDELDEIYSQRLYPHAVALSEVTIGFDEFLFNKKNKTSKFEFNDLEHMTAKLLRENEDIRQEYINKYEEILMDEYQDTNGLQEEIFNLISNGKNRFMVGDLKQSIYGFRSSDPMIFREKDELYSPESPSGNRVVLSGNFRSREDVLESINVLFGKIMSHDMGGVEYNDEQALHYLNRDFDNKSEANNYTSELYVIEGNGREDDEDELLSDEETEANFVADKIRQMIDSRWQVYDKGAFRDVKENDFAIIMNAVKADSGIYINALKQRGLNAYSEDKDFFGKTEINLIISFVKAVNNPMNDIPLVSAMRSPVYRFTDSELAEIRLCGNDKFWRCVLKCAERTDALGKKCADFAEHINKWRALSRYMSADRLIWRIMTDCSLYDMCGILYGGEAALANLRLFMDKARILSNGGIATLYDFENYISTLMDSDGVGSAPLSSDGIPIMTIHKSKGLEFPVVFVCRTGKKFVLDGFSGHVNIHKDLGFGLNDIHYEESYMTPTLNRKLIGNAKNKEAMSEQLRKLYVAMTRAKEKLIVTGVVPASTEKKGAFEFTDYEISEYYIEKSKSFMQMIAPAIKKDGGKLWEYNEIQAGVIKPADFTDIAKSEAVYDEDAVRNEVFELFSKYENITIPTPIPAKVSVSELKNKSGFSSTLQRLPSFMNSGETGGAAYGTMLHNIMEHITIIPEMTKEHIHDEIIRINGIENQKTEDKIFEFFNSELGTRASGAVVKREEMFEIQIPAMDDSGVLIDGKMLLQGIVDMYFIDGDKLVVIDYKTDKCNDISELADKYAVQLKWYRYAMEKLLERKVDEVYIYSFHKNAYIEITEMTNNE